MDENKRKKLHEIGYRMNRACGLCKHGCFKPNNDFGECELFRYDHLKHTGESRKLSINRLGSCPKFELDHRKFSFIHGFMEFLVP